MVPFRWIACIALYTILIGPVVGVPQGSASREQSPPPPAKAKPVKPVQP